jgi:hypothetical protein
MTYSSIIKNVLTGVGLAALLVCPAASASGAHFDWPSVRPAGQASAAAPTAAGIASVFVSLTSAYARAHHDRTGIANVDCVQAARGRYMCSYTTRRPARRPECHLMQARWTPQLASTFTVTLAGRVKRCATLQQALHSLG